MKRAAIALAVHHRAVGSARVQPRHGKRLARLCALPLLLLPLLAHGVAACIVTSSGVALGSYTFDQLGPTDATGNISVSCSLDGMVSLPVTYEIRLSTGISGSYAQRQMGTNANRLHYNLYSNPARSAIWGDGTAGSTTVSDSYLLALLNTVRDYPVYGRAPPGQNIAAGVYTDVITVTVLY